MIPQAKMLRVLELIFCLCRGYYTTDGIAVRLDVSPRTAARYLILLKEVGFIMEQQGGAYRIKHWPNNFNPYKNDQHLFSRN